MRFSVPVDSITTAFAAALSAVARKSTKPVLMHVKCEAADDGTLTLHGFNGECGVVATVVGATVNVAGSAILQGAKFLDILKLSRGHTVSVVAKEKVVVVSTGKSEHRLASADADQFPDVFSLIEQTVPVAEIAADGLLTAIRRAGFAATDEQEDERFDSRGVLINSGEMLLQLASMRPSLASIAHATLSRSHAQASAMVHPSSLRLLSMVIPDGGELVELRYAPGESCSAVAFRTPVGTLWTRTVEASVPPISKIVPKEDKDPAAAWSDAKPMFRAVQEALVSTDLTSMKMRFTIQPGGGVTSTRGSEGQSDVEFEVPEFAGSALNIALNSRSLKTVMRALAKESVRCQVYRIGEFQRVIFRYGDDQAGGITAVMEMTNSEEG